MQDISKALCDELNAIRATFPIFDEVAHSSPEAPKGSASAEQLLKLKRFFIKAADLGAEKIQAKERKMRIQNTCDMVQVCFPFISRICQNLFASVGFAPRSHVTLAPQHSYSKSTRISFA